MPSESSTQHSGVHHGDLHCCCSSARSVNPRSFPSMYGFRTPWKVRHRVSALIHAATHAVTAGVYMVARMNPLSFSRVRSMAIC